MSIEQRLHMSIKTQSTPSRKLLPSPMDKASPVSNKKRALNELSINLPPRPHSAQEFTTPEHPSATKRYRKVSEPYNGAGTLVMSSASVKKESPAEDSVWGQDVELAFQEAIRKIPKLGRRKVCMGTKPCGRNELIANYILRATGKVRTRKQVSSHIQVLKHIRRDDPEFLALVADAKENELDDPSPKYEFGKSGNAAQHMMYEQDYAMSLQAEENRSPLAKSFYLKSQQPQATQNQLQFDDFSISQIKAGVESHVYTRFMRSSLQTRMAHIDEVPDWALRFPCMPEMLSGANPAQCSFLHVKVSLSLPDVLNGYDGQPCVLHTKLALEGLLPRMHEEWYCDSHVYTCCNEVLRLKQCIAAPETKSSSPSTARINLPYATDFWACFLGNVTELENQMPYLEPDGRTSKPVNKSAESISNITMVQRVATTGNALDAPKSLCIMMWEFRKARRGEDGVTTVTQLSTTEQTRMLRPQAPVMSRTLSQPSSVPRQSSARGTLGASSLQRSHSMAAVPQQSSFTFQPPISSLPTRQVSMPIQYSVPQQSVPSTAQIFQDSSMSYANSAQLDVGSGRSMTSNADLLPNYGNQVPYSAYAMARSISAPSWQQGNAPTQYPSSLESGLWNDSSLDWTVPDSASYFQTDFHDAADEFFLGTPSRPQSAAPFALSMEPTNSSMGLENDTTEESHMPQLGFFPLHN